MKLSSKILALATSAAAAYTIVGCSAPAGFSYQNVAVSISAQCSDCQAGQIAVTYNPAYPAPSAPNGPAPAGSVILMPNGGQGGTILFVANVANAPGNATWTLYPQPNLTTPNPPPNNTTGIPVGESGSQVGTIRVQSGGTAYYANGGVPVYSGAALQQAQAMGIPQGDVLLVASVPNDPSNPSSVSTASQLIQIYGTGTVQGPPSVYLTPATPTTPTGVTTPAVTVAKGTTYQFYGGAAGAAPCVTTTSCNSIGPNTPLYTTDNSVVWAVGPANKFTSSPSTSSDVVVGGNSSLGTITQSGLYTAPATPPSSQPVVYVWSHYVKTVSMYAYVQVY